ncbi:uncharacterized protein LOC130635619 [Hydractinia symbiolongicarpus]|uniref:uncharacterized protein LOC130635502 n=1 Tax=Hydractinia symbiolongicarpus TaxID=13093 RepID=UPI00254E9F5A|nr:uncharacterized protein LOC130635502 [Hydractinia symbiolongicarpus]XP_057300824.1 uncharacterized protein LOC130635502 [Hydractinia symbiolongicarpus]XP_057300980.1 uncharacterized protein LOC130635619 [Hydractinia symbiolongicarpus]XP_057300981.1 uncharacterized protein LOC130635619 [Hydractinia symbiolongicarpus]
MAQPPPYYGQPTAPGYAYPPQQPMQHNVIIQNPPQPVYVQPQQKSHSEKLASGVGGAFASAFRSGGQLVKGSGKSASSLASSVGGAAAGIVKSSANLAGDAAKGFKDEADRTATSPLLNCFLPGSGIQLVSKASKGCLRCLPDGNLDGRGALGLDYSCHWLVVNRWENKVILRNGAFPQYHLANAGGRTTATGVGDRASTFKLHETMSHYVTFQHDMTGQYVGVDQQQNLVPAPQVTSGGLNSLFEVHLVYSPSGHTYKPIH